MEETDMKEIMRLVDGMQRLMMEMLELAPGIGWSYIREAERRAYQTQTVVVRDNELKVG